MSEVLSQLDNAVKETAWVTLIALYLLHEKFEERESEWKLIADKAKEYLKRIGLAKPDKVVRALEFDLV